MRINDSNFELYIKEADIQKRILEIAQEINEEYKDKNPIFISVLNGSFMFAADLMKHINIRSQISFIKVTSYKATESTGVIQNLIGLNENVFEKHVVLIEDIVDTGNTISHLIDSLSALGTKSLEVATLLHKPEALKRHVELKYIGFNIPNKFVIGYGLDYDGYGRNLPDIYQIVT
jgi:hypoxanthine phosphoribosyltransferase